MSPIALAEAMADDIGALERAIYAGRTLRQDSNLRPTPYGGAALPG